MADPQEHKPFDEAIDWLLNSGYVPLNVETHFWHINDEKECDCEERI